MRTFFRNIVANYISLFLISNFLITALVIKDGLLGYTKAVIFLSVFAPFIKWLLKILLLPINLLTLGLANFLIGFIVIYLLTLIIPEIEINNVNFNGVLWGSFQVESGVVGKFIIIFFLSLVLTLSNRIILWLLK